MIALVAALAPALVVAASETSTDDELIIIDDGDAPDPATTSDEGVAGQGRTLLKAELSSRLLLDTGFEDTGEDVVEWWSLGRLRIDHRQRGVVGVAEAWVRWGVAAGREAEAFDRSPRWVAEVELREGYLSWRPGPLELKVGQRIFAWGKNEVLAAADVLNPVDLRYDPLRAVNAPKDAKVPVFAIDIAWFRNDWGVQLVAVPFFAPHRLVLSGRDFALAVPGSVAADLGSPWPLFDDDFRELLTGRGAPEEAPENMALALRGLADVSGWDLAVTAYYGWDRTPRVRVDPDLALLLANAEAVLADPTALVTDPVLGAAVANLQRKALAGDELARARYGRMWRLAFEAQGVLGDLVIRADLGYTPRQAFYTRALESVRRPTLSAAVGVEYTRGEAWYLALTAHGLAVFDVPPVPLVVVEGAEIDDRRDVAALLGLSSTVRKRWVDHGIEINAKGGYNVQPGDGFFTVEVAWDDFEPHTFRAGVAILTGPSSTLGGRYDDGDLVYIAYEGVW